MPPPDVIRVDVIEAAQPAHFDVLEHLIRPLRGGFAAPPTQVNGVIALGTSTHPAYPLGSRTVGSLFAVWFTRTSNGRSWPSSRS